MNRHFFVQLFSIYFAIYQILSYLLPACFPSLSIYESEIVIILFNKIHNQAPQCISLTAEFRRTKQLFEHFPIDKIRFIEYDCGFDPINCKSFSIFAVPQVHAYVVRPNISQINKNKLNKHKITTVLKENATTYEKIVYYTNFFYHSFIFFGWTILKEIIPYLKTELRFSERQKIPILFQYSDEISYSIAQISHGKLKPNTQKFSITPYYSPIDFSYQVFAQQKCGVATVFDTIIPTNIRDLYDHMLTSQFKKRMPNPDQVMPAFIDARRFKDQVRRMYNITNFPQIIIEHKGTTTMISPTLSLDDILRILYRECS